MIEITTYKKDDLLKVIEAFLPLAYDKISGVTEFNEEKVKMFLNETNIFPNEDCNDLVVAKEDGSVVGIMNLLYEERKKYNTNSIKIFRVIRKYGFINLLRIVRVAKALERKPNKYELHIEFLSVNKKHQSKGIGKLLIEEALNRLNTSDKRYLSLDVIDRNDRARDLYEKLGFYEANSFKLSKKVGKKINVKEVSYMKHKRK